MDLDETFGGWREYTAAEKRMIFEDEPDEPPQERARRQDGPLRTEMAALLRMPDC